jgi:hypothetical protein
VHTNLHDCIARCTQRVDGKNGNNDGLIDYGEFLPWYKAIVDKHYKFVVANEQIESPTKKSPTVLRSAPPPPVSNFLSPHPLRCLPLTTVRVLLFENLRTTFVLLSLCFSLPPTVHPLPK